MKVCKILCWIVLVNLCVSLVGAIDYSSVSVVSMSLVNQNPDPALAGGTVEMRFRIENSGGQEANDLEIELLPKYPFNKIPDEEYIQTIKTLSAYQQGSDAVTVRYRVKVSEDAAEGRSEIQLKQGKTGSDSYTVKSFNVTISSKEFAQITYIDKSKLSPGQETKLEFNVTNAGNSVLRNLVFSWDESTGTILPVFSDNTKYIKSVDIGKSVAVDYFVVANVDAAAGLYQLNLKLKFESANGTTREINTKAGVFVGGETDFDVTFSESSAGQTSLSVANTGNNQALSVTVKIPEQENFRVTGSTSSIIGNLDKGDYTVVSFQIVSAAELRGNFSFPGAPPGGNFSLPRGAGGNISAEQRRGPSGMNRTAQSNNLKVQIDYTDTTGVRRTLQKTVPIQFRAASAEGLAGASAGLAGRAGQQKSTWTDPAVLAPVGALVLLSGLVGHYLGRRSRKPMLREDSVVAALAGAQRNPKK